MEYIIKKSEDGTYSIHVADGYPNRTKIAVVQDADKKMYEARCLALQGLSGAINDIWLGELETLIKSEVDIHSQSIKAPEFYCGCRDKKVLALLNFNKILERFFEELQSQRRINAAQQDRLRRIREII